jgi:Flp pilus assembly pilin Flp
MLLNKKAQSTLEYAVIIAVVVAALIAMQAYVKRGLQGKYKQASDDIGEQYSPGGTTSNQTIISHVDSTENITLTAGGGEAAQPNTDTTSNQTQNRSKNETVGNEENEWWGD